MSSTWTSSWLRPARRCRPRPVDLPAGPHRRRPRGRRGRARGSRRGSPARGRRGSLESLALFDVYRGEQVGEGRKSLAYRLTFRAADRTLTTDEVSAPARPGRRLRGDSDRRHPAMSAAAVAVVTGASRGIGDHLATPWRGPGMPWSAAPARSRQSRTELPSRDWVGDIVARNGRIDLLVNNAGVIDTEVPLLESDPDEWWQTVEINLRGPYLMTRAVLPHMVAARCRAHRQHQLGGGLPQPRHRHGLQRQQGRARAPDRSNRPERRPWRPSLRPGARRGPHGHDRVHAGTPGPDRLDRAGGGGRAPARDRGRRAGRLERPTGPGRPRHAGVAARPCGRDSPSQTAPWG